MSESKGNKGYGYGRNRGSGRGHGLGRGGRGRGRGRGGGQGNWRGKNKNCYAIEHDKGSDQLNVEKEEILRKRRERFERDAEKEKKNVNRYGLISRGDDLTLKRDAKARLELYEETMRRVERYESKEEEDVVERDAIFMSFRKLRECIVSLEGEGVDDEKEGVFFREVYLESVKFGVRHCPTGAAYIAGLEWLVRRECGPGEPSRTRVWLVRRLAEHVGVVEGRVAEALQLLAGDAGVAETWRMLVALCGCGGWPGWARDVAVPGCARAVRAALVAQQAQLLAVSYRGAEREGRWLNETEDTGETGETGETEGTEGTEGREEKV